MRSLVLLLALTGCDWSLHRMQERPTCKTGNCTVEPVSGAISTDEPEAPPAVTRELLVRGRDRFERICAACHGLAADGDSQVARAMTVRRPPSLVDAAAIRLTDERIVTVIGVGYGVMPKYDSLSLRDRYAVMHYVRVLQGRELALGDLDPATQAEARRWLR